MDRDSRLRGKDGKKCGPPSVHPERGPPYPPILQRVTNPLIPLFPLILNWLKDGPVDTPRQPC